MFAATSTPPAMICLPGFPCINATVAAGHGAVDVAALAKILTPTAVTPKPAAVATPPLTPLVTSPPLTVTPVSTPFYKKAWFWAVGGVVVLGGGYVVYRRKKHA